MESNLSQTKRVVHLLFVSEGLHGFYRSNQAAHDAWHANVERVRKLRYGETYTQADWESVADFIGGPTIEPRKMNWDEFDRLAEGEVKPEDFHAAYQAVVPK